jgi:HEAT repeat protein
MRLRSWIALAGIGIAALGACRAKPAEPTLDELLQALAGSDEQKAGEARLKLIALGEPAAAGLAGLLPAPDPKLRARAASTLWMLGEGAAPAAPALATALGDSDVEVRRSAAMALGNMGEHAAPAVPALARALDDPDGSVRQFAAKALGAIGPAARAALPALEALARTDALKATAEEAMRRIRTGR